MWIIFYSDGTTLSSATHTPFSIDRPHRRGVQVIIQDTRKDVGWHTTCGDDYYVWDDRGGGAAWWGVDFFGLCDYLLGAGEKCVLFGESVENVTFYTIFEEARQLMWQISKTGFIPNERHP